MLSLMHMQGQAWYLSPPFVVMALTDDDIPDTARLDLASVLGRNLNHRRLHSWETKVLDAYQKINLSFLRFCTGHALPLPIDLDQTIL